MVELAIVLPFLALIFCITVDFARVYYYTQVITNCAQSGATFASHPDMAYASPYGSVEEAALASAEGIRPAPTVTSRVAKDQMDNEYAEVRVSYPFSLVGGLLRPSVFTIERTARYRIFPSGI